MESLRDKVVLVTGGSSAAAAWLCSDAASHVTGQSMIVDGGMTSPTR